LVSLPIWAASANRRTFTFSTCSIASARLELLVMFSKYTATAAVYTLSLHDALPISASAGGDRHQAAAVRAGPAAAAGGAVGRRRDRKSTRLNSSHVASSYAVFCLKKKSARLELLLRLSR